MFIALHYCLSRRPTTIKMQHGEITVGNGGVATGMQKAGPTSIIGHARQRVCTRTVGKPLYRHAPRFTLCHENCLLHLRPDSLAANLWRKKNNNAKPRLSFEIGDEEGPSPARVWTLWRWDSGLNPSVRPLIFPTACETPRSYSTCCAGCPAGFVEPQNRMIASAGCQMDAQTVTGGRMLHKNPEMLGCAACSPRVVMREGNICVCICRQVCQVCSALLCSSFPSCSDS